ncbi:MAG: hypothetical protein ACI9F2_000565 [Lysobacterales bacterium]
MGTRKELVQLSLKDLIIKSNASNVWLMDTGILNTLN